VTACIRTLREDNLPNFRASFKQTKKREEVFLLNLLFPLNLVHITHVLIDPLFLPPLSDIWV